MAHQVNENQSWDSQHNPQVPHPDFLLRLSVTMGGFVWSWKSFEAGEHTGLGERNWGSSRLFSYFGLGKNRVRQPLLLPKGEFKIPTGSKIGKAVSIAKKAKDQPS